MDLLHREELQALRSDRALTESRPLRHPGGTTGQGPAVLLVGHGSHLSPDSAQPVHVLARRLRDSGEFSEVRVAFWKEEPQLHHAFDLVEGSEVVVVPIFTSEGYFTERVLPRELGLGGPGDAPTGRRIHYTHPVGSHPRMATVTLERAHEAAPLSDEERARTSLVVIGHGTERHRDSGATTYALVQRLRRDSGSGYGEVVAAFLDQEPRLPDVLANVSLPDVVAVPFFISDGWHAGTTIPRDLAGFGHDDGVGEGRIRYARAVGTHPAMADVVAELVAEQVSDGQVGSDRASSAPRTSLGERADRRPIAGEARRLFLRWIAEGSPQARHYLETVVWATGPDEFEIRHAADRDEAADALQELRDPEDALVIAARTSDGSHRPLRTAPTLQRGWRLAGLTGKALWEAYSHLYPAVPVHQFEWALGALTVGSYGEVAPRQTGMYGGIEALSAAELDGVVSSCCGVAHCLREPIWHRNRTGPGAGSRPDVRDGDAQAVDGAVFESAPPCPRPCSMLISAARRALDDPGASA